MKTSYKIIQLLLRNHNHIFLTMFESPELLKYNPEDIKAMTSQYSTGEQLMRDMALDIWSASGNCNIHKFLGGVDEQCKADFINAIS